MDERKLKMLAVLVLTLDDAVSLVVLAVVGLVLLGCIAKEIACELLESIKTKLKKLSRKS